jgi:DNA-binding MarR family transcriptional regulator
MVNATDSVRARVLADYLRGGREASRLSVMFRHAVADRLGLTVSDMECLDFLMDTGSATAGQLAARANLTTGAITGMIRRLEQAGYVSTERDPADRRRVIVTLRAERIEQGRHLYERFGARVERMLDGYTTEEVELLARHHDRMAAVYLAELDSLRAE